jgi:hypothetical protein
VSPNAFILKAVGLAQKDAPLSEKKSTKLFVNVVGSTPRGQFVEIENSQSKGIEGISKDMQVCLLDTYPMY